MVNLLTSYIRFVTFKRLFFHIDGGRQELLLSVTMSILFDSKLKEQLNLEENKWLKIKIFSSFELIIIDHLVTSENEYAVNFSV